MESILTNGVDNNFFFYNNKFINRQLETFRKKHFIVFYFRRIRDFIAIFYYMTKLYLVLGAKIWN